MSAGRFRALFAGGGTGGHLFPGLALAQEIGPSSCLWLCTQRPFDAAELQRAGVPFEALASPRWGGPRGFLAPMARALAVALRRIRAFGPDVVVGVGGYGAVPPAMAAAALGVPYVLLEQNARAGRANRILAPGATRIYLQWEEARNAFGGAGSRVRVTGSPLRAGLRARSREEALRRMGLEPALPTVAVVGGSQGAEVLNLGAPAGLDGMARRVQMIHVAGRAGAPRVRAAYLQRGARAVVRDFVEEMDWLYSAADLLVARAGALTIAEIAAFGVAAVVVPIARSVGDHQGHNARALQRRGAALLVEERDLLAGGLAPILARLVGGDPLFARMRQKVRSLARPAARREILDDLRGLRGR